MELGEQIATLREEQALTQVELAEAARISPSTLSQIESGKVPSPHVGTVRKIARALGVEPAELRRTKELSISVSELLEEEAPKVQAPSTSPKQAAEAGSSEISENDLADLCGELFAELQSVRETPAEDLKAQAIADLDAQLKEAQAALSTAINRTGPARLSELNMHRVMRQRRQRARQSDEGATPETA